MCVKRKTLKRKAIINLSKNLLLWKTCARKLSLRSNVTPRIFKCIISVHFIVIYTEVIAIWYLKRFPLQKKYTLQQQNCVRLIFLISVAMELLLFVSLKLTCLYIHGCPWSKFNKRKSLPWLAYVIRARLWKLLTWTISSFWWKR